MFDNKYFRFCVAFLVSSLNLVPYAGGAMQLWISLTGYLLGFVLIAWILLTPGDRKSLILGMLAPIALLILVRIITNNLL